MTEDRWAQTKADVLRRCAARAEAAKLKADKPALDSPRAIAELQRLWGMRALTMPGVAERWSSFLGTKVTVSRLRDFVNARRAEFPDRRVLNYGAMSGPHPYAPPTTNTGSRLRPVFIDEALQDQQFDVFDARDVL